MTAPEPRRSLIVLSPHLDDGVLSCGGRLAATADAGRTPLLITVFAGDDPVEPGNPLASQLRTIWNLPAGGVVAIRRDEDKEAAGRVGADPEHWPFLEALYRDDPTGQPLYPSLSSLYGSLSPFDHVTLEAVAVRIQELPETDLLLAPLGVGGHVDHLLVRAAAEASGREIAYYEEFPYSEWKWFAVGRALGSKRDWLPESLALDPELLERQRAAILAYRSQVPALFRTEDRLGRQLRRHARRAHGERIWRRRAPPPARPR